MESDMTCSRFATSVTTHVLPVYRVLFATGSII